MIITSQSPFVASNRRKNDPVWAAIQLGTVNALKAMIIPLPESDAELPHNLDVEVQALLQMKDKLPKKEMSLLNWIAKDVTSVALRRALLRDMSTRSYGVVVKVGGLLAAWTVFETYF